MNIFVAIRMKIDTSAEKLSIDIEKYLPARPAAIEDWSSPEGQVRILSYHVGPVYKDSFLTSDGAVCFTDGILLPTGEQEEHWPLCHLTSVKSASDFSGEGEFAVVWSHSECLFCHSNIGGSHALYITETPAFVAISNRSVCLLGLPDVEHELDPGTVRWKAFQGYAYGRATAFAAIRKILNGSWVSIGPEGLILKEPGLSALSSPDTSEAFKADPLQTVEHEIDRIADYMRRAHERSGVAEIDVSLSGGKDSRVILGLTRHAGLMGSVKQVWTRGPLYSPEVLSAQDVCAAMQIDKHEIRRPPLFSASYVTAGLIIRTIANHEGMLSLFDICGITPRNDFRFQGHELGLRAGRFANAEENDIDAFVKSSARSWNNSLGVVREPKTHYDAMEDFFREAHSAGAPVGDLGDIYSVFERLPAWAAVMNNSDYCGGAISNPLLGGRVIQFAFSMPPEFRRTEAFHYLALRRAAPELITIPFAMQRWSERLLAYLSYLGASDVLPSAPPYKNSRYFPNEKSPYITNVKLDLFGVMKPIVKDILLRERAFFDDLFDVRAFIDKQSATDSPSMQYLYASLGLYSAALMKEYNTAIFDRTKQPGVIDDLQGRLDASRRSGYGVAATTAELQWPEIVERHERSIAALARELHEQSRQQHPKRT